MPIKLTMQENPQYLFVICSGKFEPDAFIDACKEALSFASEKKITAILMDGRKLTGELFTTMERFKVGEAFANLQRSLPYAPRVAVVGNEPLVDPNRFGETVAVNRGALGRVFTDIDEATRWLERWNQEGMDY
jgi:hypothetical protein